MDPVSLLTLASVPGVGLSRLRALIDYFGDPDSVLSASVSQLTQVEGISERIALAVKSPPETELARAHLHTAENAGARLITYWDTEYPDILKSIYDPPLYLFIRGELQPRDEAAIAVVGTRTPSAYGKVVTKTIAGELAAVGATIVSGMALGVDGEAHKAALEAGGRTIAVLGSGIDVIYPKTHKSLMEQIIDNGAVLSEFLPGSHPARDNFPRRNRVISGLSRGTVIVEAPLKSGALLTAAQSLDQNREVFAVPGLITSHNSKGTNRLIKNGQAALVESADDILKILGWHHATPNKSEDTTSSPTPDLSEEEKIIWQHLSAESVHIDELAQKLEIATHDLLGQLLGMELRGIIRQLPGKHFVRDKL